MNIVSPVPITDAVLQGSTVAENDCPDWSYSSNYAGKDRVVFNHNIYEATGAGHQPGLMESVGNCVLTAAKNGLAVNSATKEVWFTYGTILFKRSIAGSITQTTTSSLVLRGVAVDQVTGDVWLGVTGTGQGLYKKPAEGTAVSLAVALPTQAIGSNDVRDVAVNGKAGIVYFTTYGGAIFKYVVATSTLIGTYVFIPGLPWSGIAVHDDSGDVYAVTDSTQFDGSAIYKQTAGVGKFVELNPGVLPGFNGTGGDFGVFSWQGVAVDQTTGDVYILDASGGLYMQLAGQDTFRLVSWPAVSANVSHLALDSTTATAYAWETANPYDLLLAPGGNVGYYPSVSPDVWLEVGATNRWRMFDVGVNTQTTMAEALEVLLAPGKINTMALLNISALALTVTMTSDADGVVYSHVEDLIDYSDIYDWYTWCFSDTQLKSDVALLDLPLYTDATVGVRLDYPAGEAACGLLVCGIQQDLGATQYGMTFNIIDYSTKSVDVFGNVSIIPRAYAKRMTVDCLVPSAGTDRVARILAPLRSEPILWIGVDFFSSALIMGYYKDFSIVVQNFPTSKCSLEIEGLI